MKAFWAVLGLGVIGCAPAFAPGTPEAVVSAVFDPLARSSGKAKTKLKDIPMTETLRREVYAAGFISDGDYCSLQCKGDTDCISRSSCEASGKPAEIEIDVAGFCSDCSGFTGLKIAKTPDSSLSSSFLDAQIIAASFRFSDGRTRSVYFHMMDGDDGWQVDNIVGPDGSNLRKIAFDQSDGVTISHWTRAPSN